MNDLRRQIALVGYRAFSEAAGKGAFLVVTVFATRRLSPEGFGEFSLGTTIGWMAAVASDFGIQLHFARLVAQRPADARALLNVWFRIRLWTAVVVLAVVAIAVSAGGAEPSRSAVILLCVLAYLVSGLVEFLHYFYRSLSRSDLESTLVLWQRGGMLVLAGGVLWWRPGTIVLALAMLVPAVGTLAYSLRRAYALAPARETRAATAPADWTAVVPIGTGILLSAVYFRIDVFLIEWWIGTAAVGLYNAVFRLVDALRLLPAAVLAVALPVLFRSTSRRPFASLSAALTVGAVFISAVFWVGADWFIALLYGAPYAAAVPAFRVLLLAFPLMALNNALTHQLIAWRGHQAYAALCAASLLVNLGLNARAIPSSGIVGAAWTTVVTEMVLTLGCLAALSRTSPLGPGLNLPTPSNVSNPPNLESVS